MGSIFKKYDVIALKERFEQYEQDTVGIIVRVSYTQHKAFVQFRDGDTVVVRAISFLLIQPAMIDEIVTCIVREFAYNPVFAIQLSQQHSISMLVVPALKMNHQKQAMIHAIPMVVEAIKKGKISRSDVEIFYLLFDLSSDAVLYIRLIEAMKDKKRGEKND